MEKSFEEVKKASKSFVQAMRVMLDILDDKLDDAETEEDIGNAFQKNLTVLFDFIRSIIRVEYKE